MALYDFKNSTGNLLLIQCFNSIYTRIYAIKFKFGFIQFNLYLNLFNSIYFGINGPCTRQLQDKLKKFPGLSFVWNNIKYLFKIYSIISSYLGKELKQWMKDRFPHPFHDACATEFHKYFSQKYFTKILWIFENENPQKSMLNRVKPNLIWIVITLFWLFWHHMEYPLVPNRSEKSNCNPNLV